MRNEFSKRCEMCFKYREAHMYPRQIKGKSLRLCKECWEIQENYIKRDSNV